MKKILFLLFLLPFLVSCSYEERTYPNIQILRNNSLIVSSIEKSSWHGKYSGWHYSYYIRFSSDVTCRDTIFIYQTEWSDTDYACPFHVGDSVKLFVK